MAIDAYRTLGLEVGATPAEVKRAYRRLAKAFHPDSAGPSALPRFLAIHEAYEHLAGNGAAPTGRAAAGGAGSRRGAAGPEPWRADPAKARTAREQARTNRPGSARSSRSSGPAAEPKAGPGQGSGTGAGTRRRASRKATLGSTSYDEARDATDTTWAGASWYGPTSGEYWRVNPREYADPRKHGPEYQSRARRRSTTTGEGIAEPEVVVEDAAEAHLPGAPQPEAQTTASSSGPAAPASPAARAWAAPPRDARRGTTSRTDELPPLARLLEADSNDPIRRLGWALLAWAPIGLAGAAVIGQVTGCSTYAATCGGIQPLLPWLAQAIILGLLLLVPPLARVLAVGSLSIVLALLPLTAFFLAFGASAIEGAPAFVQLVLTVVWVAGVGYATVESTRRRPSAAGT